LVVFNRRQSEGVQAMQPAEEGTGTPQEATPIGENGLANRRPFSARSLSIPLRDRLADVFPIIIRGCPG
jgi:hypothetical protein